MKQCSCPKLYVCHVPNPQKSEGHKQVCLAQAVTSSRNNFVVGQRCIMAEASRVLRPGPQSLDELCSWPLTVVQSLVSAKDGNDGERFSRLKALLGRGLWIDSDYSGIAGEHEVMHQMVEALNLVASGSGVEALKDVKIVHGRFCDKAKQQQQVLRFISSLHNNSICVFDDLNDRLPETARAVLDNMTPKQKISSKEAADLYRNMSEWLLENRAWAFAQENSCQCLVHDRRCRGERCRDLRDRSDHAVTVTVVEPVGVQPFNKACEAQVVCVRVGVGLPPVQEHCRRRDCPPGRARRSSNFVRVNMAGTVCTGWSAAGKGLHFADPSERPHAIWASERVARAEQGLEDFMISECTPRYPVQAGASSGFRV